MKTGTQRILNRLADKFVEVLSSSKLTVFVLIFFSLESLWVACSYTFPMLYDEHFHFKVIEVFTHHLSPVIRNQPTQYDVHGSFVFGSVSLYHYLMSIPLRVMQLITPSLPVQVVALRVLNIAMATIGLYLFVRMFDLLNVNRKYSNVAVLVFALLPTTTLVAATINYDNMMFLLTPAYLIACILVLRSKKPDVVRVFSVLAIGLFASLVKFSFLPLFAGSVLYISHRLYKDRGLETITIIAEQFRRLRFGLQLIMVVSAFLLSSLFTLRYLVSIYRYHTPVPSCIAVLGMGRCSANPVVDMEIQAKNTRAQREASPPEVYAVDWTQLMVGGFSGTATNTAQGKTERTRSPQLYRTLTVLLAITALLTMIYQWKALSFINNNGWTVLVVGVLSYVFVTFLFNANSYYQVHLDINTQPRYILPVMIPIITLGAMAVSKGLGKKRVYKVLLLVVFLLLSTQGGGVMMHIHGSQKSWYWQRPKIINFDLQLQRIVNDTIFIR